MMKSLYITARRLTPKRADESLFQLGRMRKHDIDVAVLGQLERLAAANGNHVDREMKALFERR